MERTEFLMLLQAALLAFDGVIEQELIEKYHIPKRYAAAGVRLAVYLQSMKIDA